MLEPYSEEEKCYIIKLVKKYAPGVLSQDDKNMVSFMEKK
jgi:hypothetical protein